jgi:hypothetical protein
MPKYEKGKKEKKGPKKAVGAAASALLEKLSEARLDEAYGISITMMYEPAGGGAPAAAEMAAEAETGLPDALGEEVLDEEAMGVAMEGEAVAEAAELDELSNMPMGTPGRY